MPKHQFFEVSQLDDVTVVELLNPRASEQAVDTRLELELTELVAQQEPQHVLVLFGLVKHCPTTTINALIHLKKQLAARGGTLRLAGMSRFIRERFEVLNLDGTVFDIYDSVGDAMADF